MKSLLILSSLSFLPVISVTQSDFLQPNRTYLIENVKKSYTDLNTFLFLKGEEKSIKYPLQIIYYDEFKVIKVSNDSNLLAFYNVEKVEQSFSINNYTSLRKYISFNDTTERKYKIKINNSNKSKIIVEISNYGPYNKLKEPIILILKLNE